MACVISNLTISQVHNVSDKSKIYYNFSVELYELESAIAVAEPEIW